jgi:hypothetical protein
LLCLDEVICSKAMCLANWKQFDASSQEFTVLPLLCVISHTSLHMSR